MHFDCRAAHSPEAGQLYRMVEMRLKSMSRIYRKKRKQVAAIVHALTFVTYNVCVQKESNTNKQKLVAEGRIPVNGIAEVQELVMRDFARIQRLSDTELSTEAVYYQGIGLCVASDYGFAVQSRILAIAHMRMGDLPAMFDTGVVLSQLSKTRLKYGPQPILFTSEQLRIHTFFVDRIRIHLQSLYPALGEPEAFLFPSRRQPLRLANVALQLKSFFVRVAGNNSLENNYAPFLIIAC
jgi:hypothetical protein